jgi:hypothetical protein
MSTVQAPTWFTSEQYSFIRNLDARGWLLRLKRAAWLLNPDWPNHYEEWRETFDLPDLPKQFDPNIRLLTDYIPTDDLRVLTDYTPPAAVQVLETPQLAETHDIERLALLLEVSLIAPDDVIIQEFKRILSAARERHPAPVKQPGPQVLKGRFKNPQFSTWRNYKILEFADLLAWKAYDKVDATDVQLGRLLSMGNANLDFDKKRTEVAKKELIKAISSIPALAAQVASEARAGKIKH